MGVGGCVCPHAGAGVEVEEGKWAHSAKSFDFGGHCNGEQRGVEDPSLELCERASCTQRMGVGIWVGGVGLKGGLLLALGQC